MRAGEVSVRARVSGRFLVMVGVGRGLEFVDSIGIEFGLRSGKQLRLLLRIRVYGSDSG